MCRNTQGKMSNFPRWLPIGGLNTLLIGKGDTDLSGKSDFQERWMVLRRTGKMYDSVWQGRSRCGVNFLFCNKPQSSLVEEALREMNYGVWIPFRGSFCGQVREVQRKPLPAFVLFCFTFSKWLLLKITNKATSRILGWHVLLPLINSISHLCVSDNHELSTHHILETIHSYPHLT